MTTTSARAIALVRRAAPRLFVATMGVQLLAGVSLAALVLAGRQVLQSVLDANATGGGLGSVAAPLLVLAVLAAVSSVAAPVLQQLQRLLGELAQRAAYDRVLNVTGTVAMEAFETSDFFDRLQRVQANAVLRPMLVARSVVDLVGGVLGVGGLVLALLVVEPLLVPLLLATGLPLFLVKRRGSRLEFAFAVAQTPAGRLRSYLREVLLGREEAKEVRAFDLQARLRGRYDRLYDAYLADLGRQVRVRVRLALQSSAVVTVVTAVTMLLLLQLVLTDRIALAEAGAAVLAVRLLGTRIELTFSAVGTLLESALFLDDLDAFVADAAAEQPQLRSAPEGFAILEVQGLGFRYPDSDAQILDGVNLTVSRGEVVALVGENGSGKTTLAKVIAGLYRPVAGRVLWDGIDATTFDPVSQRRRVAVIFQDFVRFALPARDNVALDAVVSDPTVAAAARQAGADPFLAALPDGYDTVLSKEYDGGQDLSGGQWQRVALARAFHRDAPLVVLDEPTAALDPRAEHELFTAVRTLLAGRTVLLISHRLATVRSADRIVVLAAGRVVEQGSHDELMAMDGTYAELFRLQAAGYRP